MRNDLNQLLWNKMKHCNNDLCKIQSDLVPAGLVVVQLFCNGPFLTIHVCNKLAKSIEFRWAHVIGKILVKSY